MGVKYNQMDIRRSIVRFRAVGDFVDNAREANLHVEGAKLAEQGRDIIRTSGFNRTWESRWRSNGGYDGGYHTGTWRTGSGPGRIDTGNMLNDFEYDVQGGGSQVIRLRVGWINRWMEYYKHQNEGFHNWPLGQKLEGMEIGRNLRAATQEAIKRAGRQIVRGGVRYLRGGR